jgi:acyl-coenzyme A thioesterase PaaI-like protein
MSDVAIQDHMPDHLAVCYGCGHQNSDGLRVRTFWDGETGRFRFSPGPNHTAYPGIAYGGLLASLVDCHSIGTATAAAYDAEGRPPGQPPWITFVTGNLNVRYLRPTPLAAELELVARIDRCDGKKTVVQCDLFAEGERCVTAEVVAVRVLTPAG